MSRFVGAEWEQASPRGGRHGEAGMRRAAIGLGARSWPAAASGVGPRPGGRRLRLDHGEPEHRPLQPDPADRRADPSDLAEALPARARAAARAAMTLLDVIRVAHRPPANGRRCEPGPGEVLPPAADAAKFTMLVDFACGSAVRRARRAGRRLRRARRGPPHPGQGRGPERRPAVRLRPRHPPGALRDRRPADVARSTGSFVLLGVEHILTGYDHLLFLLGLLLRGRELARPGQDHHRVHRGPQRDAGAGGVRHRVVPERLVEAVIALSIAFVAAENIFLRAGRVAPLAGQLLLRPRPRLRLLVGPPRAGPARPWPRRWRCSGSTSGWSWGRGWSWRRGPARAGAGAARGLGAADDVELVAGDPARGRRPLRRARLLLTTA